MYNSLFELVCQLEDDGCVSSTVEAVALLKDPSYAAVLQHLGIEIKGTWNKSKMSALFDQLQAALDQDIDDGGKGTGGGGKQGGEGKGIAGGGKGIAGSSGDGDEGIGGKGTDGGGKPGDGTGIAAPACPDDWDYTSTTADYNQYGDYLASRTGANTSTDATPAATPADTPAPKRAKKDPDRLLETLFFSKRSFIKFRSNRANPDFRMIDSIRSSN